MEFLERSHGVPGGNGQCLSRNMLPVREDMLYTYRYYSSFVHIVIIGMHIGGRSSLISSVGAMG